MADNDPQSSAERSESSRKKQPHRRAPRACDECRLRKSKCDGLQPCEPCRTSDRFCAYNLVPGKNTGPGARVRILEDRLRRARAYLGEFQRRMPDLAAIDFDSLLGSHDDLNASEPRPQPRQEAPPSSSNTSQHDPGNRQDSSEERDDELRLDSMMNAYGRMELSESDKTTREFYGAASGLAFLHRTETYFEERDDNDADGSKEDQDIIHSVLVRLFDAPLPKIQTLSAEVPLSQLLPHRNTAKALLKIVLEEVYLVFDFLDEETFTKKLDRIYDLEPIQYNNGDREFLPLMYAVLALGFVFSKAQHRKHGCTGAIAQAMIHFVTARNMVDVTNCRDLSSLQVLVCFILFLMSTARLGSAHAYIGLAAASAMRQGLHFRSTHESSYSALERDNRRRVFWSVVKADMYVSTVLGLPAFIDLSDVDPAIDLTLEHAMNEAKTNRHVPQYQTVLLAASAKHIEIMRITAKAGAALYPKPLEELGSEVQESTISVSINKLQRVEEDFHQWGRSAAKIFPDGPLSDRIMNLKYELEMVYYFGQIILYRPFLHYLAVRDSKDTATGRRQTKCAMACIKVAMNVIARSETTLERGCLSPASWTSLYTVFLAVVCLIFLVATQREGPIQQDARKRIESGIRILATVACTDDGSTKCLEVIKVLLKHVSDSLETDVDAIQRDTEKYCCSVQPDSPTGQQIEMDSEAPNLTEMFSGEPASFLTNVPSSWGTGFPPNWAVSDVSVSPTVNTNIFGQQDMVQNAQPQYNFYQHHEFPGSQLSNSEEAVEIAYTQTFSWPYPQSTAAMPSVTIPASSSLQTQSLSPQDVAAFMRISPGQEPFA